MAMSGTPTASTAGVSVLGGLTHILKLGERLQPQVQELQQAGTMACPLPSWAWPKPALVLWGPA